MNCLVVIFFALLSCGDFGDSGGFRDHLDLGGLPSDTDFAGRLILFTQLTTRQSELATCLSDVAGLEFMDRNPAKVRDTLMAKTMRMRDSIQAADLRIQALRDVVQRAGDSSKLNEQKLVETERSIAFLFHSLEFFAVCLALSLVVLLVKFLQTRDIL